MYDAFQANFRRAMAVFLGKSATSTTANAKGWTSDLLIDVVAFLELLDVRLERGQNITH